MTETGHFLRIPGVKERIPISQEDYERARDTLALMGERVQEETLFDQLAANVIEWQQAMVRLAGRANGSTLNAWERIVRECDPVRRVANVLSAALSFLENVDKEEKHKKRRCGNAMCTIARELQNRLQHGKVEVAYFFPETAVLIDAPQMKMMPANFTKTGVELKIRWQPVRDQIKDRNKKREEQRKAQFERACRQEFPGLETVDVAIVVNSHLRCLSDVMNGARPDTEDLEKLAEIHHLLLKKAPLSTVPVHAVSPESETTYVQGAVRMLTEIVEFRERNRRLPDLELVQFGGGSPTQGNLRTLTRRIEHMLEKAENRDLTAAEARSRFELDLASQETKVEPLVELVRRLHETAQAASRNLLESSLQLSRIEAALAQEPSAGNDQGDS